MTGSRQLLAFKRGPTVDLWLDDLTVEVTERRACVSRSASTVPANASHRRSGVTLWVASNTQSNGSQTIRPRTSLGAASRWRRAMSERVIRSCFSLSS